MTKRIAIAELEGVSPAEFRRRFMGNFTPNRRDFELYKRLAEYYLATPDHVSNRVAYAMYRDFISWAKRCGYSQKEINRAKGIVSRNPSGFVEVPDELVEGE